MTRFGTHNPYALLPILRHQAVCFGLEFLVTLCLSVSLTILFNPLNLPETFAVVSVSIVVLGELACHSVRVRAAMKNIIQRLYDRVSVYLSKLIAIRYPLDWIFAIITLIYLIIAGYFVNQGLHLPLANRPESAGSLISSVVTVILAVITIFFSGSTVVLQLLVGAYSPRFVQAFLRDWIFPTSLFLFIAIALGHLLMLRTGWNAQLSTASFYSACYVVVTIGILVRNFSKYLQVTFIIKRLSLPIQAYIRRHVPGKAASLTKDDSPSHSSILFRFYVLGNLPSVTQWFGGSFKVPTYVIEHLEQEIDPIFDACLRAIREDRRDIVTACLDALVDICNVYLDCRYEVNVANVV